MSPACDLSFVAVRVVLSAYAHEPMTQPDDPGWPHLGAVLMMLVPGARLWYMRRQRSGDPLVLLRAVFLNFSLALVGFGVVLVVIGGLPNGPVVPWVPLLVASAVVSIVDVQIYRRRALSCESEGALAASYRNGSS
jgi:hypothetical protein